MTHKIVITDNELIEMIAKRFGVDFEAVSICCDTKNEKLRAEIDLGAYYVNSEVVVKGETK